jgi:hypothetical protein
MWPAAVAGLAALVLAGAPVPAAAQGVEAEGARETIIGSDVRTDELSAEADAERIVAAIENSATSTQEVRRRFNLNEVEIVLLDDIDDPDNPVAEAVETNQELIDELRLAIEGSAMFFHAVDSRRILLRNVIAMEFENDDVTIFAIGGGEVQ